MNAGIDILGSEYVGKISTNSCVMEQYRLKDEWKGLTACMKKENHKEFTLSWCFGIGGDF